jgi:hypothetical protein
LRRAIELAEPATQSPMETRLRLLLVMAGLPRPQAQVSIHDTYGRFLGRPTCTTQRNGSVSNTTVAATGTAWSKTTAGRTAY